MKHLLTTIIAAVLVVGCGEAQQSAPPPETKTEPPTAKAPDISIHVAAGTGNIEVVKQHIAAGVDVNAKDEDGGTPLHRAAGKRHKYLVELPIADYAAPKEVVELLIAKGADVNAKGGYENGTPLHYAARDGRNEVAELLIANGADVNIMDDYGTTPLDRTIIKRDRIETIGNQAETIALLRKHGGRTGEELKAEGK